MKVSQPELLSSTAVVLYIALFSHSPPKALRSALSNVFIASVVFVVIAYITLWRSRTVGVLLILAFLLTMTRVTEHLTTQNDPPTTDTATSDNKGTDVNTDKTATTPAQVPADLPTAPATPPTATSMCNVESFAPY